MLYIDDKIKIINQIKNNFALSIEYDGHEEGIKALIEKQVFKLLNKN